MNGKANGSGVKDRVVFALGFLVGQTVEVTKADGSVVTGVLTGAKNQAAASGATFEGVTLEYASVKGAETGPTAKKPLNIAWSEVESLFAADAGGMIEAVAQGTQDRRQQRRADGGFRTDTDISSGARAGGAERKLQSAAWLASPPVSGGNGDSLKGASLEGGGPAGSWDQFKVNEEKFGVKSTYDESLYTTSLDKRKISEDERRRANRVARAIESQSSNNYHVLEERGQKAPGAEDLDEEARYSSVARSENAYQPPHRRDTPDSASTSAKGDPQQEDAKKAETGAPEAAKPATGAMSWAARVRGSQTAKAEDVKTSKPEDAKKDDGATAKQAADAGASDGAAGPAAKETEKAQQAKATPAAAAAAAADPKAAQAKPAKQTADEKRMSDRQREIDGLKEFSETLKTKTSGGADDKNKKKKKPSAAAAGGQTNQETKAGTAQQASTTNDDQTPTTKAKKSLNSEAKEWRPNVNAKEFTPSMPMQSAPSQGYGAPPGDQGGMPYGMAQGGFMPMAPGYGYPPQMMYPGMPMPAPSMYSGHYGQPPMGYYHPGGPQPPHGGMGGPPQQHLQHQHQGPPPQQHDQQHQHQQ